MTMDAPFDFDRRPSGKVLFAEDFDLSPAQDTTPAPEVIEPTFSLAELETARAEAWQAGSDVASAEAAAADHAVMRQTVTAVAAQLAAAHGELVQLAEQSATAIARLLLGSLGAVLPELAATYGEAELQAITRIVLPGLFKEPAVTLRINPLHCTAIAREIERLDPDLAARLQTIPTESIPAGDVRIGWRNGGATRDAAALWEQVSATLALSGLSPALAEPKEIEHAG
jgi:flagellar biosynthesis/type III secretory pathway protein FliH